MPAQAHTAARSARANGWTPQRKRLFFATLAAHRTVAMACARVGLSREAAYKARRRDADFARRWQEAQACARRAAERAFFDSLPDSLRKSLSDRRLSLEPEGSGFSPKTSSIPSG